jgi:hypothetical protein
MKKRYGFNRLAQPRRMRELLPLAVGSLVQARRYFDPLLGKL